MRVINGLCLTDLVEGCSSKGDTLSNRRSGGNMISLRIWFVNVIAFISVAGCGSSKDQKAALVGSWSDILHFDQDHFSSKITMYGSESERPKYEVIYYGDYAANGSMLSRHVTRVSIKPMTLEIVNLFHGSMECGVSDWALGQASDARDLTCETLFVSWMPKDQVQPFSIDQDTLSIHKMVLTRTQKHSHMGGEPVLSSTF